jgi:GNAT superfamily N-acetyltransferase
MTIRELDPERDAEAVVDLIRESSPLALIDVDQWRHTNASAPERSRQRSWVAELDGDVVGRVVASRAYFSDQNDGFVVVTVAGAHRGRGIGERLYRRGLDHVLELGVDRVLSMFDENDAGAAFAERRGFAVERAEVWSVLDPREVTELPSPSIELAPAAELDPRELHRIDEEATRDMPSSATVNEIPYDEWVSFVWEHPFFTQHGSFGAVVDGHVAAVALLLVDRATGRGITMFTGTGRDFRGRGLGLAVKLASVRWAAANGIVQLATTNDETNAAMLAINERLGYRPSSRRIEVLAERERLLGERGEHL